MCADFGYAGPEIGSQPHHIAFHTDADHPTGETGSLAVPRSGSRQVWVQRWCHRGIFGSDEPFSRPGHLLRRQPRETRRHGMKSRGSQHGSDLAGRVEPRRLHPPRPRAPCHQPGDRPMGCVRRHRSVRFRRCPRPKFVTNCDRIEDHCHLPNSKPYAPDQVSSRTGQGAAKPLCTRVRTIGRILRRVADVIAGAEFNSGRYKWLIETKVICYAICRERTAAKSAGVLTLVNARCRDMTTRCVSTVFANARMLRSPAATSASTRSASEVR